MKAKKNPQSHRHLTQAVFNEISQCPPAVQHYVTALERAALAAEAALERIAAGQARATSAALGKLDLALRLPHP